jgi:hypothetical protein
MLASFALSLFGQSNVKPTCRRSHPLLHLASRVSALGNSEFFEPIINLLHPISYQYLRGVSFPLTKQDQLGLARSSSPRSSLLHTIEAMAEGDYKNTDEVVRALGSTAH